MNVSIQTVVTDESLIPSYAHDGDAGLDLRARLDMPIRLQRGSRVTIPTGVKMAIPRGMAGLVCPRSGWAQKHGLTVANSPGLIDSNYRGEIGVILQMHGDDPLTINPGERIAQLVIVPVATAAVVVVDSLDDTERGEGGFGSSGT